MLKEKFINLPERILSWSKWLLARERLGEAPGLDVGGRGVRGAGFLAWLLGSERLPEDPVEGNNRDRAGNGSFLGWLLSFEKLPLDPEVTARPTVVRTLFSTENLVQSQDPESSRRDVSFLESLFSIEELGEETVDGPESRGGSLIKWIFENEDLDEQENRRQ